MTTMAVELTGAADLARPGTTTNAPAADSAVLGTYKRAPVTFVRGEGVELFDTDGRAYLDFTSGIAVNALGYADPGIEAAIRGALESGVLHTSNLYSTEPGEKLARFLVDQAPFASKAFFCNSGAEANEAAFKFARRWARSTAGATAAKHEIVALRGAFHGRTMGVLAATDRPAYRIPFRPLAGGISIVERDLESLGAVLSAETSAAVIVEPVQGEGGVRVLDAGWLRELRALTRERGVALVLDEIQCGLGRTGYFFAHESAGIEPDMVTLAKPLAGGLPMGAVLLAPHVAAAIQPGDHGTTFGGGPFVASVALHVVERLADPRLLEQVRENGEWLGEQLVALGERTGRIRAVRGTGLMWGIDTSASASEVVANALDARLLLCSAGNHTVRLLPPLTITRDELKVGVAVLEEVLQ
ncbi:MAG TPA: acetylornithine/succinylornithine family transaminase [Gemmatimonadaceae bacterium]|nr:acetylornithine/succinylornithine family transaminase [Gemmatimonadaceae bacterium]